MRSIGFLISRRCPYKVSFLLREIIHSLTVWLQVPETLPRVRQTRKALRPVGLSPNIVFFPVSVHSTSSSLLALEYSLSCLWLLGRSTELPISTGKGCTHYPECRAVVGGLSVFVRRLQASEGAPFRTSPKRPSVRSPLIAAPAQGLSCWGIWCSEPAGILRAGAGGGGVSLAFPDTWLSC